jgi:DNA-3-methyladenine glycosylase II
MDAVHTALLPATPPFALGAALRALTGFAPCAGDQTVTGDRVRKALVRPGSPSEAVVVDLTPRPDRDPGVALQVFAARPLDPAEAAGVELAVRRWLSLDDDLRPFLTIAGQDPALAPVLAATEGLHQVRFASLAEGAVYFTLTQRSTQWYAAARKRRIAAELGPRLVVGGVTYVAFPELSTVLTADLVGYAGNAARGQRLADVVAGVAALDPEWLRSAPYPHVRDALLAIRGVGTFTAHALLLRVLGRPDDTPLEMAQFTAVARALFGDPPPSPQELREWYGSYVGWWAYLCRTGLGWLDRTAAAALPAAA